MILALQIILLLSISFAFLELFLTIDNYNYIVLDEVYKILSSSVYYNCIKGFLRDSLV